MKPSYGSAVYSPFSGTACATTFAVVTSDRSPVRARVSIPPRLTWDDYLRLPERESAVCPECGAASPSTNGVWWCDDHEPYVIWRWPGVLGMD